MINLTANSTIKHIDANMGSEGGKYSLKAQGNFGGGTLIAGFSLDGGTTITAYPSASFTANGSVSVEVALGDQVYIVLSGATSPSLKVEFSPVPHRRA